MFDLTSALLFEGELLLRSNGLSGFKGAIGDLGMCFVAKARILKYRFTNSVLFFLVSVAGPFPQ